MTTRYRPWMCHYCGHTMDAASHLTDDAAVPREGDISACIACGGAHILCMGQWIQASEADMARLEPEVARELARIQRGIGQMVATLGRPGGKQGGRA